MAFKTRVFDLTSADPIPWRLVVLGNERLPKTVYVRFRDISGDWDTQTYTDDIVLQIVVPQILSVTLAPPRRDFLGCKSAHAGSEGQGQPFGSQIHAGFEGKPRKKAKGRQVPQGAAGAGLRRLFVRVRDGAGNWSKWRGVA